MLKYFIVYGKTSERLASAVNAEIEHGYWPHGGVTVVPGGGYYQAMLPKERANLTITPGGVEFDRPRAHGENMMKLSIEGHAEEMFELLKSASPQTRTVQFFADIRELVAKIEKAGI